MRFLSALNVPTAFSSASFCLLFKVTTTRRVAGARFGPRCSSSSSLSSSSLLSPSLSFAFSTVSRRHYRSPSRSTCTRRASRRSAIRLPSVSHIKSHFGTFNLSLPNRLDQRSHLYRVFKTVQATPHLSYGSRKLAIRLFRGHPHLQYPPPVLSGGYTLP